MTRFTISRVLLLLVFLGSVGLSPDQSTVRAGGVADEATPTFTETCTDLEWWMVDARPPDPVDASVIPAVPTADGLERELYLVTITLKPGECVPYQAPANQKDGAVVWIVQQGKIKYTWQRYDPLSTPVVMRGALGGLRFDISPFPGDEEILYPGDWITQDQRIAVTYQNIGSDSAILIKAVYARPVGSGGGCGGDCR